MNERLSWSRFNFLIRTASGDNWLYNSYSNCLLKIDDALFDDLKKIELACELTKDKLIVFSSEEISYFKKNYILTNDDDALVEVLHTHSMSRLFSRKTLVLTIAPTQCCNFACTYCFEKWRNSAAMTDQTEDSIIRYIQYMRDNYALETINITWYGGEPLMQSRRILSLSKRIKDLGLTINENLLITNGYFFSKNLIEELYEVGITQIQITIDGLKEIHDKRRPLINGDGTFDVIINNLDNHFAGKYRDQFTIAVRVNIDKRNYANFVDIYHFLKERYKSNKLIVYPGIIVLDEADENVSSCLSRNDVTDIFIGLFKNYGIMPERLYPDEISMECMVRNPYCSMLVGSEGEIYKCYEDLGNKKFVVGNINEQKVWDNFELISKYATGIDHYIDPVCRKCSYIPICNGGCPKRRYENVYQGKHNDCCTPFKDKIQDYIELYSELISRKNKGIFKDNNI